MLTTNKSENAEDCRSPSLKLTPLETTSEKQDLSGLLEVLVKCKRCGKEIWGYPSKIKTRRYCDANCRLEPYQTRFWKKVDKTGLNGCWLWLACRTKDGYGQFPCKEIGEYRAHRVSWVIAHGAIPKGVSVLHRCPNGDNRNCVNPDHLYLGTQSDNMRDSVAAGTHFDPQGENHPNALLSNKAVKLIRACYNRRPIAEIAQYFNVSVATIRDIAKGRSWQHVEPKNYWTAQGVERLTRKDNLRNLR